MKRAALWCLIIASTISGTALAADISHMNAAETIAMADKNGDNQIDREEYQRRMTEVFFFLDTDKDGSLSQSELQQIKNVDPQRLESADTDGNHSLSLYEFLYAVHIDFETVDQDHDGRIDADELNQMRGK